MIKPIIINEMANNIVYMGSPEFTLPVLESLLKMGNDIVGVYTQPDKVMGRGLRYQQSAVKQLAEQKELRVIQPKSLKSEVVKTELKELSPDVIVIAAYGQILPKDVLTIPNRGCINIHPSLLPRHRGPSPVANTFLEGDKVAGVTIMLLDEGLDTGPILASEEHEVYQWDTTETLTERLFREGAKLLETVLPRHLQGTIQPRAQEAEKATYSRKLKKEDGYLIWNLPAEKIWNKVRGLSPWPGTYTYWNGKLLKILRTIPIGSQENKENIGKIISLGESAEAPIGVVTAKGFLGLLEMQMEGKNKLRSEEFVRGYQQFVGSVLPS